MLSVQPPVIPQRAHIPLHVDEQKPSAKRIELNEVILLPTHPQALYSPPSPAWRSSRGRRTVRKVSPTTHPTPRVVLIGRADSLASQGDPSVCTARSQRRFHPQITVSLLPSTYPGRLSLYLTSRRCPRHARPAHTITCVRPRPRRSTAVPRGESDWR